MKYVGIDPDVAKSGYAVWCTRERKFETICAKNFFDLIEDLFMLYSNKEHGVKVIIEAGWLNKKSNYHKTTKQYIGERIAKNVGANHQIGKLIEEFCKRNGYAYELIKPTKSKTNKETFSKITGLNVKNQDVVDAAMLVYGL